MCFSAASVTKLSGRDGFALKRNFLLELAKISKHAENCFTNFSGFSGSYYKFW